MGTETSSTLLAAPEKGKEEVATKQVQTSVPAAGVAGEEKKQEVPAGEQKSETKQEAPAKSEAPVDFELKFPEGVKPDAQLVDGVKAWAKEHGVKPEAAQKLADLYTQRVTALEEAHAAEYAKQATQQQQAWVEQAKADKELGGAQLEANLAAYRKAVVRFGGEPLYKLLDGTGLGDHPEIFRAFLRAGKAISEDSIAGSSGNKPNAATSEEARLKSMYPNSPGLFRK